MLELTAYEIIRKKNNGGKLTSEEIAFLAGGCLDGRINDFQTAAFICSLYHKGMDEEEVYFLTLAMASHGEKLDLSSLGAPKFDKHSTGGVGDGVTLMLAPLAASLGIVMPTMAGRSLGYTGGTIDKLEAIPGIKTALEPKEIITQLSSAGCAVFSQSPRMAPADRKIYAVRDQISCVDSDGLITASILSKKMAESIDGLIVDLKVGSGAFIRDYARAKDFAALLGATAKRLGLKTVVYITDMDQPLGKKIGSALEVEQACEILQGASDPLYADIKTLLVEFASEMLVLAGLAGSVEDARQKALRELSSGAAFEKFKKMVSEQKGDTAYLDGRKRFAKPKHIAKITAPQEGYIKRVDAEKTAFCLARIGALNGSLGHSAGIVFEKKCGDFVKEGDILGFIHHNLGEYDTAFVEAKEMFLGAYEYSGLRVKETNLIKEICYYE